MSRVLVLTVLLALAVASYGSVLHNRRARILLKDGPVAATSQKSMITVVANNNAMKNWLPAPEAIDHAALDEMDRKSGQEDAEKNGGEHGQKFTEQKSKEDNRDEADEQEDNQKEMAIKNRQEGNDKSIMESGNKADEALQKQISQAMQENGQKEQTYKERLNEQANKQQAVKADVDLKAEQALKNLQKAEASRQQAEQAEKKRVQAAIDAKTKALTDQYNSVEQKVKATTNDFDKLNVQKMDDLSQTITQLSTSNTDAVGKGTRQNSVGTCSVWGDPHITTFGGTKYDWYGTGEYILFLDQDAEEQINAKYYKPLKEGCNINSATAAASFRFHWLLISVETKHIWDACTKGMRQPDIRLYVDVSRRAWNAGSTYFATQLPTSLNIKMESEISVGPSDVGPRKLLATITNPPTQTSLAIYMRTHQFCCMYTFDLHVTVAGFNTPSPRTYGLCGRWQGDVGKENDLYNRDNKYFPIADVSSFAMSFLVESAETLHVLHRDDQKDAGEKVRSMSAPSRTIDPSAFYVGNPAQKTAVLAAAQAACTSITDDALRRSCNVDFIVCGNDDECSANAAKAAVEEAQSQTNVKRV